jgi:ketosteroid isomerase-like protein
MPIPSLSPFVCLLFLASLAAPCRAQTHPGPKAQVLQVLESQQAAWNRHDLEGFMEGYWNSEELTFFSGAQRNSGWQSTLDHYRQTYQSAGREMGRLEFSDLNVDLLSPSAALVRGQWKLTMSDQKLPHGVFTLIFRRFPQGWKIVHDHTSVAQ